jgi:signal transduction histidine kinase
MQQHDLRALLQAVTNEYESLVEQRDLTIRFDDHLIDAHLAMDREKIGLVLRNLLSNAIKFSPDGAEVQIELLEDQIAGPDVCKPAVCCRIRDQGPGIPLDELDLVFGKYAQSSRNPQRTEGTGLGLAIARELVIGHGGTIRAMNNVDTGTCFTICLPR